MINKLKKFIFYFIFNLQLMLNVFLSNEIFNKNHIDISKFLSFFSRLWKKNLIFKIEQFHDFFQFCWYKFKFVFARRYYIFNFFTFVTTFIFKEN